MMARAWALLLVGLAGLTLAACNTVGNGASPGVTGTVPGASAEATTGLASGAIGRDLDSASLKAAREAEFRALEFGRTGVPVPWRSGSARGEVVPGARYQVNTFNCRDFVHTVFANGTKQSARATSCRQPNGSWEPVT